MKYYLSSYRLGNQKEKLKEFVTHSSNKFGYIPNALDFIKGNIENRIEDDINDLRDVGIESELLDLKEYFGKENELKKKLSILGGIYIRGGNVFVLREAMKLSGLDNIILESKNESNFIYSGYSAAACVLSPSLKAYAIVDDAKVMPYPELQVQVWDGLGILDFAFMPHYHSHHPESQAIDEEVQYCIDNKIAYRTFSDGEVLILE